MKKDEKMVQYAGQITAAIAQMFLEDSDNYINQDEFEEGDNLTQFIHALANMSPTILYNELTGDSKNYLQFNHLANQLCFQFSNKSE